MLLVWPFETGPPMSEPLSVRDYVAHRVCSPASANLAHQRPVVFDGLVLWVKQMKPDTEIINQGRAHSRFSLIVMMGSPTSFGTVFPHCCHGPRARGLIKPQPHETAHNVRAEASGSKWTTKFAPLASLHLSRHR